MESFLLRQLRILQVAVVVLLAAVLALGYNALHPSVTKRSTVIDAERINIRESDGTIKAVLANSAAFSGEGQRAQDGGVPFSGLMFYNQEGVEEGGLVYDGKSTPTGQNAEVSLTFDQYRQDQNIYLHHEEHKDANETSIDDGLTINSRPDHTAIKAEYRAYETINKLPKADQDAAKLKALQDGVISTRRLFFGDQRGNKNGTPFDNAGLFIKNRWGKDAMKIYVDYSNVPHLEVYDQLGKSIVYDLPLSRRLLHGSKHHAGE